MGKQAGSIIGLYVVCTTIHTFSSTELCDKYMHGGEEDPSAMWSDKEMLFTRAL